MNIAGGAAYPGFNDYYQEGGWGNNLFEIPSNNGQTLQPTRSIWPTSTRAESTFCSWPRGTTSAKGRCSSRPSRTASSYLKQIQQFTGVAYGEAELQLVYRLYLARKKYAGDAPIDAMLDQVSTLMAGLEVENAVALMDQAAPAGDYDADGAVDQADYVAWRTAFGTSTILYGSGADGNFDGIVDIADYTVWRNSFGAGQVGQSAAATPEPSAAVLLILAAALSQSQMFPIRYRIVPRQ